MVNREAAYQALFERLAAIPGWASSTRDYHTFEDHRYPQPGLVVAASSQVPDRQPGRPLMWNLEVDVLVYHRFDGSEACRSTVLNAYVDAINMALLPQPGEPTATAQTNLGGAVQRAWIESVQLYEGTPEQQGVVHVRVLLLAV